MYKLSNKLFDEISNFKIDTGHDALTFTERLCRENKWTSFYAKRCVDEYKRFIYLAMVAEHPVTPSDQVDQVWHLHLTYTQSYWSELCEKTLKTSLHHGPTKGGLAESNKYRSQYQATLDSYNKVFNQRPSPDIWPSCQQRFRHADKFVRLNRAEYFLIWKPSKSLLTIAALPIVLAACVNADLGLDSSSKFLTAVLVVVLIFGLLCLIGLMTSKSESDDSDAIKYGILMGSRDNTDGSDSDAGDAGGMGDSGGGCGGG